MSSIFHESLWFNLSSGGRKSVISLLDHLSISGIISKMFFCQNIKFDWIILFFDQIFCEPNLSLIISRMQCAWPPLIAVHDSKFSRQVAKRIKNCISGVSGWIWLLFRSALKHWTQFRFIHLPGGWYSRSCPRCMKWKKALITVCATFVRGFLISTDSPEIFRRFGWIVPVSRSAWTVNSFEYGEI